MSHKIEVAQPVDFLEIAALDRLAWHHTGEQYIADGEHVWRVWCEHALVVVARGQKPVTESGTVFGALVMFPTTGSEMFLHKIMVHPEYRGRGIGTELMRAGLKDIGVPVMLTVDPENSAAISLYESFGFQSSSRIEGYYRQHEHRLVMIRQ